MYQHLSKYRLMYGLIVLIFFALYLAGCIWVVRLAIKKSASRKAAWGLCAFLLYNLPLGYFVVPELLKLQWYCANEAGFQVYKTAEQWRLENPGIADEMKVYKIPERKTIRHQNPDYPGEFNDTTTSKLSSRFSMKSEYWRVSRSLVRITFTLIDDLTGEVLMKQVDFKSIAPIGRGLNDGCSHDDTRWKVDGKRYWTYITDFEFN